MRKTHLLLIFMCLVFVVPLNVYALTGSMKIGCPESVASGTSNVSCTISGISDDIVTAFSAKVSISGGGSIVKFIKTSDVWHDVSYTNGYIDGYAEEANIFGNFELGKLDIKLPENALGTITITISDVIFGDKDYNDIVLGISDTKASIQISKKEDSTINGKNDEKKNTDHPTTSDNDRDTDVATPKDTENKVYLSDIIIDGYDLDFDSNVFDYTLKIKDETSLRISLVLADDRAKYSITGNENLANNSVISIVVVADDIDYEYAIKIVKDDSLNKKGTNKIINIKIIFDIIIGVLIIINLVRILSKKRRSKI